MPRSAWNGAPLEVKRRYFELIWQGAGSQAASVEVGVSPSCGSLWFIDAGRVQFIDRPISSRYLSQDDRIEIADGVAAGEPVRSIAARIGKSYQTVYREIARNRKLDGRYQPWYAHARAYQGRRRPKPRRVSVDDALRTVIADRLASHWSPGQISRWLRRRWPKRTHWHLCHETIYESVYRGLVINADQQTLRTGRTYRHKRGRDRNREGALKQSTNMKSIHQRPAAVEERSQIGHWKATSSLAPCSAPRSPPWSSARPDTRCSSPSGAAIRLRTFGDALVDVFAGMPAPFRWTLTWDQGNEMFHHERIEQTSGIRIYFADPHSPWQRGHPVAGCPNRSSPPPPCH
jgi:transposase, IS30 family